MVWNCKRNSHLKLYGFVSTVQKHGTIWWEVQNILWFRKLLNIFVPRSLPEPDGWSDSINLPLPRCKRGNQGVVGARELEKVELFSCSRCKHHGSCGCEYTRVSLVGIAGPSIKGIFVRDKYVGNVTRQVLLHSHGSIGVPRLSIDPESKWQVKCGPAFFPEMLPNNLGNKTAFFDRVDRRTILHSSNDNCNERERITISEATFHSYSWAYACFGWLPPPPPLPLLFRPPVLSKVDTTSSMKVLKAPNAPGPPKWFVEWLCFGHSCRLENVSTPSATPQGQKIVFRFRRHRSVRSRGFVKRRSCFGRFLLRVFIPIALHLCLRFIFRCNQYCMFNFSE
jgi:hypothetical protein